jgi:methionyl aminopeptidase
MPKDNKVLRNGDIISIDTGVRYNKFCTDACRTFGVGEISEKAQKLIDTTRQCFFEAVRDLKAGVRVGHIGEAIEDFLKGTEYSILENYFGHGIGKIVHEDPLIANYRAKQPQLQTIARKTFSENQVICIEPMILNGGKEVKTTKDGWTVVSKDGGLTAHYENVVIIKKDGVEIVTDKYI